MQNVDTETSTSAELKAKERTRQNGGKTTAGAPKLDEEELQKKREETNENYLAAREEFEKEYVWLKNPGGAVQLFSKEERHKSPCLPAYQFMKTGELMNQSVKHRYSGLAKKIWMDKDEGIGGGLLVARLWLTDPDRATFAGIDHIPIAPALDHKKGIAPQNPPSSGLPFNLWGSGFAAAPAALKRERQLRKAIARGDTAAADAMRAETERLVQPFFEHLGRITGHSEDERSGYLAKWIAHLFQQPRDKPGTAVIVSGEHGAGKDIFFGFLGRFLIGDDLFSEIAGTADVDLFGRFAGPALQEKMLVLTQELSFSVSKQFRDRLKGMITDTKMNIENKGVNSFQSSSHHRFVFSTNSNAPLPVETTERRYVIYSASSEIRTDEDARERTIRFFTRPTEAERAACLQYLLFRIDLTDYDPRRNMPVSQILQDLKAEGRPYHTEALQDLCQEIEGWREQQAAAKRKSAQRRQQQQQSSDDDDDDCYGRPTFREDKKEPGFIRITAAEIRDRLNTVARNRGFFRGGGVDGFNPTKIALDINRYQYPEDALKKIKSSGMMVYRVHPENLEKDMREKGVWADV